MLYQIYMRGETVCRTESIIGLNPLTKIVLASTISMRYLQTKMHLKWSKSFYNYGV